MPIFTFHLATSSIRTTTKALLRPPTSETTPGLDHMECMTVMRLGSPMLSTGRFQLRRLAVFAQWRDEDAIDAFLKGSDLGRTLDRGWHVRLAFMRRWGLISEFDGLPLKAVETDPDAPVVAVTLARMKLPQVPRFIRWGRPVEELVRDHPGTTLALAAMRLPRTVSTFSIWRSAEEMKDMVRGHSDIPHPARHADAMIERDRKDFHFEFTTLRFTALSEYGEWEGGRGFVGGQE